jgi:SMC interacting uncharacterized protein involved in chromosome segregation
VNVSQLNLRSEKFNTTTTTTTTTNTNTTTTTNNNNNNNNNNTIDPSLFTDTNGCGICPNMIYNIAI